MLRRYSRSLPFWLETLFVVVVVMMAVWPFTDLSVNTQLSGGEMEFLTSSAHYAARQLHANGYIPLWQPNLGEGRPLLESPFAFILNPFSTVPSLLYGDGIRGIKASVIIYAFLAAGGGWFCARVMGMGVAGRMVMVLLTLGKGNMVALLGIGHFQLAVAQVYIPWAVGAAFLVLRGHHRRWAAVLLAMAFALQYLAGNVWHTLPLLISLAVLTLAHLIWDGRINWRGLRGMVFAGLLMVGISAMVLLPTLANRAFIAPPEDPAINGDKAAPPVLLLRQVVSSQPLVRDLDDVLAAGELETRYNYTVPWWYLLITFVVLPPIYPVLYRPRMRGVWRMWLVAFLLFVFFMMWGMGGLQPFRWAYNTIPGLDRWRFVGRAFGMATFWLALLIALRVDGLWTVLHNADGQFIGPVRRWNGLTAHALLAVTLVAGYSVVIHNWREWVALVDTEEPSELCLAFLFAQDDPDQRVAVRQLNYENLHVFLDVGVRHYPLPAAYRPLSRPNTYYDVDLRELYLPPYAMPASPQALPALAELGYDVDETTPFYEYKFFNPGDPWHCLWRREPVLPYAFSMLVDDASRYGAQGRLPDPADLFAVENMIYTSDTVSFLASGTGGARSLAVVQEIAYPGWQAYVNGERVPAESVGGYLGVLLLLTTDRMVVSFVYRPLLVYIGAAVTLTTIAFCVLYLLRAERLLIRRRETPPPGA